MKRVSIIGCPGAGKTEFSKHLARKLNLPLIHLDRIYHDQAHPYQTDRELWRKKVSEITDPASWVIDGNYKSTFDIRFPKSDTIIFLDYPVQISLRRAIKRRFQYRNKVRADMPSTRKENLRWSFLRFIVRFNRDDAPRIRQLLGELPGEKSIVVLKNPHEAETYLTKLVK